MRRVAPSTVVHEDIGELLAGVAPETNILSALVQLGVRYVVQQGLEQEQADFVGRELTISRWIGSLLIRITPTETVTCPVADQVRFQPSSRPLPVVTEARPSPSGRASGAI